MKQRDYGWLATWKQTDKRDYPPTTKISNYSPAGKGGLSTRRPALKKTNHNEKENLFVGGYPCRCGKCLRTRKRAGGHHRSHEPNHRVFWPRNSFCTELSRQGSLSKGEDWTEGKSTADNTIQREELGLAVWSTKVNCPINIVKYNEPKAVDRLGPKGKQSAVLLNLGHTDISTAGGIDRT